MPAIGLGTWRLQGDGATQTVAQALKLGYRLIDTSGNYHNQAAVGQGIRDSGAERGQLFIVTKVEAGEDGYDATAADIAELGLKYVDLMLIHWPPPGDIGLKQWQGLQRARDAGLARSIGVSNYSIQQMQALAEQSGELPAVNQIEWSPFGFSPEMLDFCQREEIVIMAYSPLTRTAQLQTPPVPQLADIHHKTPAQIALRWAIQKGALPIPKASSRPHLQENLAVFDFELSAAEMGQLDALNQYTSVISQHLPYL